MFYANKYGVQKLNKMKKKGPEIVRYQTYVYYVLNINTVKSK